MVEQARVRCPVCRSAVPVTVLWAVGDTCPRCSQPLHAARRRPSPAGVLGKTLAMLQTDSRAISPGQRPSAEVDEAAEPKP